MKKNSWRVGLLVLSSLFSLVLTYFALRWEVFLKTFTFLNPNSIYHFILLFVIFGLILFIIFIFFVKYLIRLLKKISDLIVSLPINSILSSTFGFLVGLLVAYLISQVYKFIEIKIISTVLAGVTYIICGYLGIVIGNKRFEEITLFDKLSNSNKRVYKKELSISCKKVFDTSAIIDGRIIEISKTGFIEGIVYIPEFVLKELRHIADSDDDLTRTKGRRGLDYINELKSNRFIDLKIVSNDYPDVDEVDIKLLYLAKEFNADVVTTDYNLNKVANLHNIKVLNVNDLSNAVKPNAVAGETFMVEIIKKGKTDKQGVAYFEDGTMIVVENAQDSIGQKCLVEVTSVLQTPAGRMIFAKIKE